LQGKVASSGVKALLPLVAFLWLAASGARNTTASEKHLPATARKEIVDQLDADLRAHHGPADGGGSAKLLGKAVARANEPGRWKIRYLAGPLGVKKGGTVQFQPSPFWGWSSPQTDNPSLPGYTRVTTEARGIELEQADCGQGCLAVVVGGRDLRAGEAITFYYGAGEAGAMADRYSEHGEHFYFWVDGDGDGTRSLIAENPALDVLPGSWAKVVATLPSTAKVGEKIRLKIAFLDGRANATSFSGKVEIASPAALSFPASVKLESKDEGIKDVIGEAKEAGIFRVEVRPSGGQAELSNPIEVSRSSPRRIRWADLQGHSNLSDGTGTITDYYHYARDVAGLDIAAVTDHDHWGLGFLDQHPEKWKEIVQGAQQYYEPGRFVTLVGYEWTSWIFGHRHVLYFSGKPRLFSSLDPATDTPGELWTKLRQSGAKVLTIPHHPAGGPVAIDWSIPPDPEFEPAVEVISVHGNSECADSPFMIHNPQPGHFACDALKRGYRLGFIGSGDSHDGHPGLAHLGAPTGGLAAIITNDLTREGVYRALRSRRVYATSGPRIIMEFRLGANPMGSEVPTGKGQPKTYYGRVVGTAPIAVLELVKNGQVAARVKAAGELSAWLTYDDPKRKPGDWAYLRVSQVDGALAFSSPIWTK